MRTKLFTTIVFITLPFCLQSHAHAMQLKKEPRDKLLRIINNFREQERIWEDAQQKKFLLDKAPITVDDTMYAPGTLELDEELSELFEVITSFKNDVQETRNQKIFLATTTPLFLKCKNTYSMQLFLEMARAQGRNIFIKMVTTPLPSGATKLYTAVNNQQEFLINEILRQASNLDKEAFIAIVNIPYHHETPFYAAAMGDSLEIFEDFLIHARKLGPDVFRAMINVSRGRTSLVDYVRRRPDPRWITTLQEQAEFLHVNVGSIARQPIYKKSLPVSYTSQCLLS
jgi:hypothetical protein